MTLFHGFNWLDFLIIIILAYNIIIGFIRGLAKQIFDIAGFLLVIIMSYWGSRLFYRQLSGYIDPGDIVPHIDLVKKMGLEFALARVPEFFAGILLFIVFTFGLTILFRLLSGCFSWVNRLPVIGFVNKSSGALIGFAASLVLIYLLTVTLKYIPLPVLAKSYEQSKIIGFLEENFSYCSESVKEFIIMHILHYFF